jgi:hypothetical protein
MVGLASLHSLTLSSSKQQPNLSLWCLPLHFRCWQPFFDLKGDTLSEVIRVLITCLARMWQERSFYTDTSVNALYCVLVGPLSLSDIGKQLP